MFFLQSFSILRKNVRPEIHCFNLPYIFQRIIKKLVKACASLKLESFQANLLDRSIEFCNTDIKWDAEYNSDSE